MIIGLAGRISSGKRVLCELLVKRGYQRIYFALPLKTLLTTLLRMPSIQRLDEMKNVEREYTFMENDYAYIASETGIPLNFIKDRMEGKKFTTVRQLMQYIGTDVIRNHDPNWHIKKIKQMINPFKNYVIDDLRFPNEKEFIEEMGGDTWYICRPKIDNVINHISETSLKWQDFNGNIIINDKDLEALTDKWDNFIDDYEKNMKDRLLNTISIFEEHIDVNTLADPYNAFNKLLIAKDFFTYQEKQWDKSDIKESYIDKNNNLVIIHNDLTPEYITNRLNIEDFKLLC